MIRLYRITADTPARLTVVINAEPSDLAKLQRFGVTVRQNSQRSFYDQTHYFYVEEQQRRREILDYLKSTFQAPEVLLPLFRLDLELDSYPRHELRKDLLRYLAAALGVDGSFGRRLHVEWKREDYLPFSFSEDVVLDFVVDYKLRSYLKVDFSPRLWHNGKRIEADDIARFASTAEQGRDLSNRWIAFTTRNSDAFLSDARRFVEPIKIWQLQDGTSLKFDPQPQNAESLGYQTWVWSHDHLPILEFGNEEKGSIATKLADSACGLFGLPAAQLKFFFIYPGSTPWVTKDQLQKAYAHIKLMFERYYGRDSKPPEIKPIKFDIHGDGQDAIDECRRIMGDSKSIMLALLIMPPKRSPQLGENTKVLEAMTRTLINNLRKVGSASYVQALSWDSIQNEAVEETLDVQLMKLLTAVGATPCRITNMATPERCRTDELCFIGIDLNWEGKTPHAIGGCIFDAQGILRAFHAIKLEATGEKIPEGVLSKLVRKLRSQYREVMGLTPTHIVIHRDGSVHDPEVAEIEQLATETGLHIDLVAVKKGSGIHVQQLNSHQGTPSRDLALGDEEEGVAYLCNALAVSKSMLRGASRQDVIATPQFLRVENRFGSTSLKILAAQVYALSLINYNALHQTKSLPITTNYADRLIDSKFIQNKLRDKPAYGMPVDQRTILYWL